MEKPNGNRSPENFTVSSLCSCEEPAQRAAGIFSEDRLKYIGTANRGVVLKIPSLSPLRTTGHCGCLSPRYSIG